jgi:hypothetical protein
VPDLDADPTIVVVRLTRYLRASARLVLMAAVPILLLQSLFAQADFAADIVKIRRWNQVPVSPQHLAPAFRTMSPTELAIRGFDVVRRPTTELPAA